MLSYQPHHMRKTSRACALFLTLIIALSCLTVLTVKSASAQSSDVNNAILSPPSDSNIPTPAVPTFTVQAVNSTNFDVIISNQPFTPLNVTGQGPVQFLYSIRVGPIGITADSNWTWLYDALGGYPNQSGNQTTTITISLTNGNHQYGEPLPINLNSPLLIEVQAIIGYYGRDVSTPVMAPYVIYGEASGWSNAQTVTLPAASPASTPTPTATPTLTPTPPTSTPTTMPTSTKTPIGSFTSETTIPTIVVAAFVVLVVFVLLFRTRRKTADLK